jgi:hypothetical protein
LSNTKYPVSSSFFKPDCSNFLSATVLQAIVLTDSTVICQAAPAPKRIDQYTLLHLTDIQMDFITKLPNCKDTRNYVLISLVLISQTQSVLSSQFAQTDQPDETFTATTNNPSLPPNIGHQTGSIFASDAFQDDDNFTIQQLDSYVDNCPEVETIVQRFCTGNDHLLSYYFMSQSADLL